MRTLTLGDRTAREHLLYDTSRDMVAAGDRCRREPFVRSWQQRLMRSRLDLMIRHKELANSGQGRWEAGGMAKAIAYLGFPYELPRVHLMCRAHYVYDNSEWGDI
jgi:hypothetical protein